MHPRTGKPGSRRWRPARVRTTDPGILWAALWSCVAIASLCHVGVLAGFAQAATAATQDLEDLLLPDPGAAIGTDALDDPRHVYPAGPAPLVAGPIPQGGTLPGQLLLVPWLVFVAASHVAWLALLAAPSCRGPRYSV